MTKSVTSPRKFLISKNLINDIPEFIAEFGSRYLLLTDFFFQEKIKSIFREKSPDILGNIEIFGGECSQNEIDKWIDLYQSRDLDVIVGLGGGKTLDAAKAIAQYLKIPVIIVPTLASTDAPCTALSVIYKEDGSFDRYLFLDDNPALVLADTQVLIEAPEKYFSAGVGDALATYFEARACYKANGKNLVNQHPSRTGLGLAQLSYEIISENISSAMDAISSGVVTDEFEQVVEATIYLSGVGAESGGLAAAHAIHNGMSVISELHDAQHGEKVVFGLLVQLVLENASQEEINSVIEIAKIAKLPLTLQELGLTNFIEEEWREVARLACSSEDSMSNMPFEVSESDVYNAILKVNKLFL